MNLGEVIRRVLYSIRPYDPQSFLAAALLVAFVALLACGLPSAKAIRIEPMMALRYE